MTKKELTTLLILFGGGWLFVLSIISVVSALPQIVTQYNAAFGDTDWSTTALYVGAAVLPVLFYGGLSWFLIRKSDFLAGRLLAWGRIDGAAVIQGGEVSGLLPLLFSFLGLYFLIENLPSFLLTAFRWFVLEARSAGSTQYIEGDVGALIARYKADLIYYGISIAIAAFVLLRSAWIARQVQKFSEREGRA